MGLTINVTRLEIPIQSLDSRGNFSVETKVAIKADNLIPELTVYPAQAIVLTAADGAILSLLNLLQKLPIRADIVLSADNTQLIREGNIEFYGNETSSILLQALAQIDLMFQKIKGIEGGQAWRLSYHYTQEIKFGEVMSRDRNVVVHIPS